MDINEVGKIYERPWGTYQTLAQADNYQVKRITVNPGQKLSLQKHHQRAEHWVMIQGELRVTVDDTVRDLKLNDSVYIPVEGVHRAENVTDELGVFIEVQVGDYLGEDDIVRLEDIYNRD